MAKNKTTSIYKAMLLALVPFSGAMAAVDALKIGYVDFEAALSQEHEAQKYTKELEKEEQDILGREEKERLAIEKKIADFQKSMPTLSEKAKLEKQTALGNEYKEWQETSTKRRMEANKNHQKIGASLQDKNRFKLESIAKKEGYTMIFNAAALAYASDELKKNDITPKLVAEYNKDFPVKVEGPKKPAAKEAPASKKPAAKETPASKKPTAKEIPALKEPAANEVPASK